MVTKAQLMEEVARLRTRLATLEQAEAERMQAEEGSRSHQQIKRFIENAPVAIAMLDREMNYLAYSQRWISDYNLADQNIVGRSHYEIFPELPDHLKEVHERGMTGEVMRAEEDRFERLDGTVQWLRWVMLPWLEADDKVGGIIILTEDITERKQAEEDLRESEERFQRAMENIPDVIVIYDRDLRIQFINAATHQLTGRPTSDYVGKREEDIWPPEVYEAYLPTLQEALETGATCSLETDLSLPGSGLRTLSITCVPLFDQEGEVREVMRITHDFTERKQSGETLRKSEERYRQIVETAQEGIWQIDAEGNTVFVNTKMAEMLGYTVDEMLGAHLFSFMNEKAVAGAKDNLERRRQGIAEQHDFEFQRKDGTATWALINTNPILNEREEYVGALAMVADITERKTMEEALRESRANLEEAQRIAHIGSWEWIAETDTPTWSRELCRILEVDPDRPVPSLAEQDKLYTPESMDRMNSAVEIAMQTGAPYEIELERVREDGSRRWLLARGERWFDEQGNLIGLRGTALDITERKLTEQAMNLMSDTQRQIAALDDTTDIYQLVGEKVQKLVRDGYVVISTLDEQIQAMRVVGLYGFGNLYNQLAHRFKLDPAAFVYPLEEMTEDELRLFRSGRLEEFEGGLYALLSRKVPRSVCEVAEKQLKISDIYTMSFVWQGIHYGGLTLLAKSDITPYKDMIETIMNQAAVSIKRIRAEASLRKSEAQYRDLVSFMGSGLVVYEAVDNGSDFIIKTMNPAGEKISQVRQEDIIGKSLLETFPGVKDFGLLDALRQVWQTGEPVHLPIALYQDQHRSQWVENYLYKLPSGEVVAIYDDATKQIEAEKALVHERDLLRILLDNIPDLIYFKDADSRFTRINRAQAAVLGVQSPEEAVGRTDADFLTPEHAQDTFADEQAIVQTGKPLIGKVELIRRSDGELRWVLTTKVPVVEKGRVTSLVGITRDITEIKQADVALERYADRLEILREIDLAILSARSSEEIAQQALGLLDKLVPCQQSSITLFDFDTGEFMRLALKNSKADLQAGMRLPLEQFVADWEKLRQNQISILADLHIVSQSSPVLEALKADGLRSLVNVPLVFQSDLIGSLNLVASSADYFTKEHLEIAQEVTGQLGIAIKQARLHESEREQRTLAEALRDTAGIVNSSLELHDVFKHILDNVGRVVPHDGAEVWLIEDDMARVVGSAGYTERDGEEALLALRLPVANTRNLHEAQQSGQPVVIRDTSMYPGWIPTQPVDWARSVITVPVCVGDRTLGFINLFGALPDFYTSSHGEHLKAFADQAATAIWNAQLYEELEARRDNLEQAVEERTADLQQQKEQAEAILQSAGDAMAIADPEGFLLAVNPAFVQQTGYAVDEAVGQHIQLISSESPDSPSIKDAISAAQSVRPWRMETQVTRKDGGQFDADLSMAPLNLDQEGQLRGFVIALHDISLFKEVERMKDEFLSIAAHELRTPLTSIRGFSEILLTRDLPEERQKSYMETINKQSSQLAEIIDDLLDISRLEAGRGLDLKPEPVDMAGLIAEAVQPFVDTSPRHHFVLDGLTDAPPVQGDPFRLSQVVRNLLSNAVKYSPDGGTIVVRAETEVGYLAISVQDKGIGMTPEQQAHLFERFYRADATSQPVGGTGLGLAICKLIVEGHSGHVRVSSEQGKGSTFTFTIPIVP